METKAAVDRRDDDNFLKGIRDILLYLVFLVLYMVVAQQAAIAEAYPLSSKMKDEVLGGDAFNQILTTDDIWDYLETQFVDIAFIDEDDEGDRDQTPSGRWGYVLDVNRIIGAIQFRQKRVDVGGALPWNATPNCEVPQVFKKEIDKCYPSLASNGYASNPFGGTCGCDTVMTGVGNGVARVCATSPCDDSFFVSEDVRGERSVRLRPLSDPFRHTLSKHCPAPPQPPPNARTLRWIPNRQTRARTCPQIRSFCTTCPSTSPRGQRALGCRSCVKGTGSTCRLGSCLSTSLYSTPPPTSSAMQN